MKKVFRKVALIALIGLAATGCQKEEMVEPQNTIAEINYKTVYYSIDGIETQVSFVSEETWVQFLDWLVALAEQGHRVSFRNANQERRTTKEMVTYITSDHDDAVHWANMMEKKGYQVTIVFDDVNKEYTCTAIR